MRQEEEQGTSQSTSSQTPPRSKFTRAYFNEILPIKPLEFQLIITSFITGLLDAASYASFQVFTAIQTGNTLVLAIGALDVHEISLLNAGVSLATFCTTCLVFGQIGCRIKPGKGRTRWWAILTSFYQALMLLVGVILLYTDAIHVDDQDEAKNHLGWLLVIFMTTSAGAQITMAKQFEIKEIPTAMLTSPFADLFSDRNLFKLQLKGKEVRPRNLRILYIISLVSGVFSGAAIYKGTSATVLILIAFCVKAALMIMLFFLKGEANLPI